MLADLVGLNNVNQTAVGLGMRATRLLDWRAPGANDGNGPYTTSPSDMGRLLETIADDYEQCIRNLLPQARERIEQ